MSRVFTKEENGSVFDLLNHVARKAMEDAIAAYLSERGGDADVVGVCCGQPVHVGSPEGYTLECCGNHLVSDPREAIARIIDPHSFLPDNSGDYIVGEMVKQSRELAFRKADRILSAIAAPPAEGGGEKLNLEITKEWFERRAKAEADLEIGAGFSIVKPSDADIAQMEVLAEKALPEWAKTELARLRAIALDLQKGYIATRELVERAQAIISTSTYPNWHASARASLESKGGSDAES